MGHLCAELSAIIVLAPVLSGPIGSEALPEALRTSDRTTTVSDRSDKAQNDDRRQPTAEDLLSALRRKRPSNDVIPPASATDRGANSRRALLPEGSPIVDRSGWITRDGRWWKFVFDPSDGEPPTKLLPNAGLEVMVRTATGSTTPVKFILSGEITVFEDENYLVVRGIRREQAGEESKPAHDGEPPEGEGDVRRTKPAGTSPPADVLAEDVVSMLQRQRPKAVLTAPPLPQSDRPIRDAMLAPDLKPDGSPLVRRPGRIVRDGDWWIYVFESDHPDHAEPKMKLLPNRSVELMMRSSRYGGNRPTFIVSGEVTLFQGENFLLPRIAIRRIDTGNLRK